MENNYYYEQLMNIRGISELQEVVKHWKKLSDNIERVKIDKINILPDMLWISNSNVNKTEILTNLSNCLYELNNLMDFSGSTRFVEFYLGYNDNESGFPELIRFIDTIDQIKGFRNDYAGVIYIDISEWVDHIDDVRFSSFLEFLATNSAPWLIILNLTDPDEQAVERIEKTLSIYLRIERIKFDSLDISDYHTMLETTLRDYGFSLDEGALDLLKKSIEKICENDQTNMTQTIKHMCADIIYRLLGAETDSLFTLNAEKLNYFSSEGAYVKRIIQNGEKRQKIGIGFIGGKQDD